MPINNYFIPNREWFDRPVLEVAQSLLNARLTHRTDSGDVTIRIVEVEAYQGANDPGSHGFRGKTKRNQTMFGPGGHLYVYRHMGLHVCANIVAGPAGASSGNLLRAGEVISGLDLARERRQANGVTRHDVDLAQGPARLTVALRINPHDDGTDLLAPSGSFQIEVLPDAVAPHLIASGPRVGLSGEGGRGDLYPWRFWIAGDPYVSAYKPGAKPKSMAKPKLVAKPMPVAKSDD